MMRTLYSLTLLAALATGCTSQESASTTAAGEPATAAPSTAVRTPGTRADSLGGIPGHKFGEPLSAFPGLVLHPGQQQPGSKFYYYPNGKGEAGWWGKRTREWRGEFNSFYTFKDGRFVAFSAMAYGDARKLLREQAVYLFGQGKQWPLGGTTWDGAQVQAYYTQQIAAKSYEQLTVQTQEFVKSQATAKADQLKKDNAM